MKSRTCLAGAIALALCAAATARADVARVGVTYPEGKKISVPFVRGNIAPKAATLTGTVKMTRGQAEIELAWDKMEPAVLFGGNITSYAVWVQTSDGRSDNLGELAVREKKSGDAIFRTGKPAFAIIVTAEVLPGSVLPSDLVLFTSGRVDEKTTAKNVEFNVDGWNPFSSLYRPGNPSIANLTYSASKTAEPIELQQARRAMELATEIKAQEVAPTEMQNAKTQLEQAENGIRERGSKTVISDYARRSVNSAGTAIRLKVQKVMEERLAAEEARKKAEEDRKRAELDATRSRATAAEADKARLAGEVARLEAENQQMQKGLEEAVGKTMDIQKSARGVVLNMGEILFDVNKTTLKKDGEYAVVKLSAIMAVFPKIYARVEGFTDSSGKLETNMKLSAERARSVQDLLSAQGVEATRLTHGGYGPALPVADNTTPAGRSKNRRVEIILSSEPPTPTPGGVEAPAKPQKAAPKASAP